MNQITMTDVTMNQNTRRADFSLNFREKIELAKLLDKLGVDAILTTPISENRIDSLLIKSISSAVKESIVAVPVGLEPANVDIAVKALQEAVHPRLVVEAPVSAVQMEYLAGKKPAALLAAIEDTVSKASAQCQDVGFVAVDATRADMSFLKEALEAAVKSGASLITLVDNAGDMLPGEFAGFINEVRQNVPSLERVRLGVDCSNKLSMADANAVAAITSAGVTEIKAAAYDLNSINLEHVAFLIATRGESIGAETGIHYAQLHRMVGQIERLCRTGNAASGQKAAAEGDEDVFLTAHDTEEAVLKAVAELGYDLSEEDEGQVFDAFTRIAAHKEKVSMKELDAIVASAAMQVPPTYILDTYVINTGNTIGASAQMKLMKNGETLSGISMGDGPIDAAFHTIDEIIGYHYELDDFQIQAVTEGREAMGEAVVKLRSAGKLYSGQGISTDIVGASIHAYLNAVNKIVYETEA
ncbi:MAG: hypothetical protein J6P72_06430 [Firmicutes bacterium]|nr:hypothetical protein [Bacillota bacterium]